jgi:hypothetical protein
VGAVKVGAEVTTVGAEVIGVGEEVIVVPMTANTRKMFMIVMKIHPRSCTQQHPGPNVLCSPVRVRHRQSRLHCSAHEKDCDMCGRRHDSLMGRTRIVMSPVTVFRFGKRVDFRRVLDLPLLVVYTRTEAWISLRQLSQSFSYRDGHISIHYSQIGRINLGDIRVTLKGRVMSVDFEQKRSPNSCFDKRTQHVSFPSTVVTVPSETVPVHHTGT